MSASVQDELSGLKKGIKSAFGKVREEMDEHLDTINRNSNEIQSVYEFLMGLEGRLDKLSERVESLSLEKECPVREYEPVEALTSREQEVFLLVYTSSLPLSSFAIAERLGLDERAVRRYLDGLMQKGVPLLEQRYDGRLHYSLELRFKDEQARRSLVRIDESVSREVLREQETAY